MNGPLSGVKVLDFTTLLPGPLATLLLAEAGAEVIKIERPGHGDELRAYEPLWGRDSASFALLNRGKTSLALDLKDPAQRAQLEPYLDTVDVIVEQFRPGVMDRLGLGYQTLSARRADIIYCAITGYGQSGPKRDIAGHDLNYIGDAGLLSLATGDRQQPVVPPALVADIAGGAYPAVMNILLALRERDRSGRGSLLDISMTDNLFPFLFWALASGQAADHWPGNGDALLTGGTPRYQLYPTSDGEIVAAAPIEQRFWERFCDAIGLDAGLRDDRQNAAATRAAVATMIAAQSAQYWRAVFAAADCCCSIVQTLDQAVRDPHFTARGLFDSDVRNADGATMTALPVPIATCFRPTAGRCIEAPPLAANDPIK